MHKEKCKHLQIAIRASNSHCPGVVQIIWLQCRHNGTNPATQDPLSIPSIVTLGSLILGFYTGKGLPTKAMPTTSLQLHFHAQKPTRHTQ